jgi:calcineurin-like phosphoesterase family protein
MDNPEYDPEKPYHFKFNNPICLVPDGLEQHDEALVDGWNSLVGKKDRTFIIGDFAWNNHKRYANRLNGKKILIAGNHDKMSQVSKGDLADNLPSGNEDLFGQLIVAAERSIANKDPKEAANDIIRMAWESFYDFTEMGSIDRMDSEAYKCFQEVHEMGCRKFIGLNEFKKNKRGFDSEVRQDITLSHYAMMTWASSVHGSWQLYGHSHGRMPESIYRYSFDVGIDVWGYVPIPIEAVKLKMGPKISKKDYRDGENRPKEDPPPANMDERIRILREENLAILDKLGIKHPLMTE